MQGFVKTSRAMQSLCKMFVKLQEDGGFQRTFYPVFTFVVFVSNTAAI